MNAYAYSSDAVRDAGRYSDALHAASDRAAAIRARLDTDVVKLLTETIRTVPSTSLALPYSRDGYREQTMRMPEAISDAMDHEKVFAELLHVLGNSDCAHVAELRRVIAQDYLYHYADEIVSARGDE